MNDTKRRVWWRDWHLDVVSPFQFDFPKLFYDYHFISITKKRKLKIDYDVIYLFIQVKKKPKKQPKNNFHFSICSRYHSSRIRKLRYLICHQFDFSCLMHSINDIRNLKYYQQLAQSRVICLIALNLVTTSTIMIG